MGIWRPGGAFGVRADTAALHTAEFMALQAIWTSTKTKVAYRLREQYPQQFEDGIASLSDIRLG